MRVISGKAKGRRLGAVKGDIRPTSDRLREALFNYLGDSVPDSRWLDAMAGSGAVGIEALSRGAHWVVFNDRSREALRLVRLNLERCGFHQGFEITRQDVFKLLSTRKDEPFDFIFLDPPYAFNRYGRLLKTVRESGLLAPEGKVLLEIFKKTPVDFLEDFRIIRTLKAGDSQLLALAPDHQSSPNAEKTLTASSLRAGGESS